MITVYTLTCAKKIDIATITIPLAQRVFVDVLILER